MARNRPRTKSKPPRTKSNSEQPGGGGKGGRPSLYDPKYCDALISHMRSGMSFPSFAAEINVNPDTLYEWASVHPEFSEAKKKGEAHSLNYMERIGLLGMTGKLSGFNFSAWIASMNNKHRDFGWRRGDAPVAAPANDALAEAMAQLDKEERVAPVSKQPSLSLEEQAKKLVHENAPESNSPKLSRRGTKKKPRQTAKAGNDPGRGPASV